MTLPPFEQREYEQRLVNVKDKMDELGLEVLLVPSPDNMNYLTGYHGWSFYVPQLVLVDASDPQPHWIGRVHDRQGAKLTTWLDDDHIHIYPDRFVQYPGRHPYDAITRIIKDLGLAHCSTGVDLDSYYFSARAYERLQAGLPGAAFHDAHLLVNQVRLVKSPAEIAFMRKAARITNQAIQLGLEQIEPGVRECDVAASIQASLTRGTPDYGGDYPAIVPLMPSGERTAAPHLSWTSRRYEQGDIAFLELSGCYQRYHAPIARTVSIGTPPAEVEKLAATAIEGINAVIEAIEPGLTCDAVARVWEQLLAREGYEMKTRIGYPVGLAYPPDWGEHTASFRRGDQTVLKTGMTFHLMPGMWLDDFGFEATETILVTESGCETLTSANRQLTIK